VDCGPGVGLREAAGLITRSAEGATRRLKQAEGIQPGRPPRPRMTRPPCPPVRLDPSDPALYPATEMSGSSAG
jgi:hypothetical protein